ncbi:MAG: serine/threonine protein kinase [Nostocales cyanobacterium]|nr:MAG: serine/threonine protein kinase [Nostocales cyanobacterium]
MTNQNLGNSAKEILLERYEVQKQLGKKAGRRTLLTRDLQTQDLVVVKLLTFDDDFQWQDLKLFEREAETLKSLDHPAIPRYLDYFELDTPGYKGFALVQSYIPAESLEVQLKNGRTFNESEVKQLAVALLEILQYLHSQQPPVIHRDIKPSNILLTNRSGNHVGDVYLVDFGSVQTIVRTNTTMTIVGSYGYMPPEQFSGKATPASDLYGLGATLIYLVTGQHPADLPQDDLVIQFKEFANITPHFSNWLQKMTQPILSQRFASVDKSLKFLQTPKIPVSKPIDGGNLILDKPFGSRLVLHKTPDFIDIIIPPQQGIPKLGVMFIWYVSSFPFLMALVMLGFSFPLLSGLFMPLTTFILIAICLISLFGTKRTIINKKKIYCFHELFGMRRYVKNPSKRKNIIRLERSHVYHNQSYHPCLIIWAGLTKYEIHTSPIQMFSVSTLELDWLAQELSEWLDLPIVDSK